MVTAIPSVTNAQAISTVATVATVVPTRPLAQRASSLLAASSVILSLGTTASLPLTYSATGLLESQWSAVGTAQSTLGRAAVPFATATNDGTSSTSRGNSLQDFAAQALLTITQNPAYAYTAAGLYMSAAIFRAQQSAAFNLESAVDRPQPVQSVAAVTAVKPI